MLEKGKVIDDPVCANITGDPTALTFMNHQVILVDCFLPSVVEHAFAAFNYESFRNDGAPAEILSKLQI